MRILGLLLMLFSFFILTGCDPGIEYNPSGWTKIRNYEFAKTYDGFDVEMRGFHGLIGEKYYILDAEILNTGQDSTKLYVESAVLNADGKDYTGSPNYRIDGEIKIRASNQCQHFNIVWDFPKQLFEVLRDPVELRLVVKRGSKSSQISIPMLQK